MIKKILTLILLISFDASAQNEIIIEQSWSTPSELPFNLREGWYFTEIDGKYYSQFEPLEDNSVFYPDIERSASHAQFLEIDQDLHLQIVSDSLLAQELFLKTDFRTEWSPFIHVDRGYNTSDDTDGNWSHNWEVSCQYQGESFIENFSYTSAPNKWYGVRSSLVSDEEGLNAIFLAEIGLDGVFAKVYFIHFHPEKHAFDIIERTITYEDLGFEAMSIQSTLNYSDHEFRYNGKPGLLYSFNIDHSAALGLSTLIFDVTNNTLQIRSKKIDNSIFPILDEFNEVDVDITSNGNSMDYFVRLCRFKVSQGNESNTTLSVGSSQDILYLKFDAEGYSEIQNFSGTRKNFNLLKTKRIHDEFLFLYNEKPEGLKIDETINVGKSSRFKLWLVQFSPNNTILYEIGLDYRKLHKSIYEAYYSFGESKNNEIELIVGLNGDMFEPTKNYLIGKLKFTIN